VAPCIRKDVWALLVRTNARVDYFLGVAWGCLPLANGAADICELWYRRALKLRPIADPRGPT